MSSRVEFSARAGSYDFTKARKTRLRSWKCRILKGRSSLSSLSTYTLSPLHLTKNVTTQEIKCGIRKYLAAIISQVCTTSVVAAHHTFRESDAWFIDTRSILVALTRTAPCYCRQTLSLSSTLPGTLRGFPRWNSVGGWVAWKYRKNSRRYQRRQSCIVARTKVNRYALLSYIIIFALA